MMHALLFVSIIVQIKYEVPSFTHSKDMNGASGFKMGPMTLIKPISEVGLVRRRIGLAMFKIFTKFDASNSTGYKDIKATQNVENGVVLGS